MKDAVAKFIKNQGLQLPALRADEFRLLEPGVYSHNTLPFGTSRDGITDGLTAFIVWPDGITREVHCTNLTVVLDAKPGTHRPGSWSASTSREASRAEEKTTRALRIKRVKPKSAKALRIEALVDDILG